MELDGWATAVDLLQAAGRLVEEIQEGVRARGFEDLRPAHGFTFVRVAAGGATTADVAEHLGITKQAAADIVQQLVDRGYVERHPHPHDGRARILALTERGRACTAAAEEAAESAVERWSGLVAATEFAGFRRTLIAMAGKGPLRPAW